MTFPSPRLQPSLLAALPTDSFTGVDNGAVFAFLERNAPAIAPGTAVVAGAAMGGLSTD